MLAQRAYYVVFFDAASLTSVKLSHDISKPTAFRQLMDDGVIKEVSRLSHPVPPPTPPHPLPAIPRTFNLCQPPRPVP